MTTETKPTKTIDPKHAERLRALMDRLDLTQVQAAKYLGVPLPTLVNWVYGHREPNAGTLKLMSVFSTLEALAPEIHAMFLPKEEVR